MHALPYCLAKLPDLVLPGTLPDLPVLRSCHVADGGQLGRENWMGDRPSYSFLRSYFLNVRFFLHVLSYGLWSSVSAGTRTRVFICNMF